MSSSSSSSSAANSLLRIAMPVFSSLILAYYVFTLPMSFMGGSSGPAPSQMQLPVMSKVEVSGAVQQPIAPATGASKQVAPEPKKGPALETTNNPKHPEVRVPDLGKASPVVVPKKQDPVKGEKLRVGESPPPVRKVEDSDPVPTVDLDASGTTEFTGADDVREQRTGVGAADAGTGGLGAGSVFHSLEVFRKNYEQMEKRFKVFIYPDGDPDTYYQTPRKLTGKYASEGYFFQNLRESKFVTRNPNKAHLFFIPISCHKMRGKGISYERMADIVQEYVEGLIAKYPYWNRTLGADHFFVTCHDVGARATNNVANLVKNSIRVVCSPSYNGDFIPHKDVAMPQVLQPFALPRGGNDVKNRTILGFWAGHRNSKIRVVLAKLWENDDVLAISNNRISRATGELLYQKQFYRSKFCICPGGSQVNSARIADSIHYGCVPVILSDYYDLPFSDVLDWKRFAVLLRERDVNELRAKLESISRQEFLALHRGLVEVQDRFEWHSPPRPYDAFHMVMYELWLRHFTVQYKK